MGVPKENGLDRLQEDVMKRGRNWRDSGKNRKSPRVWRGDGEDMDQSKIGLRKCEIVSHVTGISLRISDVETRICNYVFNWCTWCSPLSPLKIRQCCQLTSSAILTRNSADLRSPITRPILTEWLHWRNKCHIYTDTSLRREDQDLGVCRFGVDGKGIELWNGTKHIKQ